MHVLLSIDQIKLGIIALSISPVRAPRSPDRAGPGSTRRRTHESQGQGAPIHSTQMYLKSQVTRETRSSSASQACHWEPRLSKLPVFSGLTLKCRAHSVGLLCGLDDLM